MTMSAKGLLVRLIGFSTMTREEMRLAGYPDSKPLIDVCAEVDEVRLQLSIGVLLITSCQYFFIGLQYARDAYEILVYKVVVATLAILLPILKIYLAFGRNWPRIDQKWPWLSRETIRVLRVISSVAPGGGKMYFNWTSLLSRMR